MKTKILLLSVFMAACSSLWAQKDNRFWFVAPAVAENATGSGPRSLDRPLFFRFSSYSNPVDIRIQMPANPGFSDITYHLPAHSSWEKDVTAYINDIESGPAGVKSNKGILITSDNGEMFSVYYEVSGGELTCNSCNSDLFSLKGARALGLEFWVPMQTSFDNAPALDYSGSALETPNEPRSAFDIVATEDDTYVYVYPSATLTSTVNNPIILNKGQTYSCVANGQTAGAHLAGSHVVAYKPIAITMKDDLVDLGNGRADLLGDQLIPVKFLGKDYIVVKSPQAPQGPPTPPFNLPVSNPQDEVYILATQNGTGIKIDGVPISPLLNAGQTYIPTFTGAVMRIEADYPIYVLHLTTSNGEAGGAILPSINCSGSNEVAIKKITANNAQTYALIVSKDGDASNYQVNAHPSVFNFTQITVGFTTWFYAVADLTGVSANPDGFINITNATEKFQLGILQGQITTPGLSGKGSSYGYFSDFGSLLATVTGSNPTTPCTSTGAASATVSLGTAPYTYHWSTGANTSSVSGLSQGYYTVDVTDANSCSAKGEIYLSDPKINLVVVANLRGACYQQCNGVAGVWSLSGGTAPYTYSWSNGEHTDIVNNLCAGAATLTVTDANGCTVSQTVTVTENPEILATLTGSTICSGSCNGHVDLTGLSGGTPGYTYDWSNGATSSSISGLCANNYTLTITDASGCQAVRSASVGAGISAILFSSPAPSCSPSCTGRAGVSSLSGGTPPYTYSWSNGTTLSVTNTLCAGLNTVTITDALGCSITRNITINGSAPIILNATVTPVSCYQSGDGAINLTVTGGSGIFSYAWNTGATTEDLSSLSGGTYKVTVTDANGCTASDVYVVDEPAQIPIGTVTLNNTEFCLNDDLVITITGTGWALPTFDNLYNVDHTNPSGIVSLPYTKTIRLHEGVGAHAICVTFYPTQPGPGNPCTPEPVCTDFTLSACDCEIFLHTTQIAERLPVVGLTHVFYTASSTAGTPQYVNWYVDNVLIEQDAYGVDFDHVLTPGQHEVCMVSAFVFVNPDGTNLCCFDKSCMNVNVDPCEYKRATDGVTYTVDANDYNKFTFTFTGAMQPNPTLIWDFGDGSTLVTDGATGSSVTHSYTNGTTNAHVCVHIVWTDENWTPDMPEACCCVDEECMDINIGPCNAHRFQLTINQIGDLVVVPDGSISVIAPVIWNITTPAGNRTFNSGASLELAQSFLHGTYPVNITFQYTVTYNGVTTTCDANIRETIEMGTGQPVIPFLIRYFPNPANDQLNVEVNAVANDKAIIELQDYLGQTTLRRNFDNLVEGTNQLHLHIGDLVNGLYLMKVTVNEKRAAVKVVKQ